MGIGDRLAFMARSAVGEFREAADRGLTSLEEKHADKLARYIDEPVEDVCPDPVDVGNVTFVVNDASVNDEDIVDAEILEEEQHA